MLTKKNDKYFMSDGIFVQKIVNTEETTFSEHKHDFVEMVYIIKGKFTHTIDGREYIAHHGDMVLINYNQTHKIKGKGVYANILMKPEYISRSLADCENTFALLNLSEFEEFKKTLDESKNLITFPEPQCREIEMLIDGIISEIRKKETGYEFSIRSQFNLLLIKFFRRMSFDLDGDFYGVSEKLLNYIRIHCHEKITLSSVAKMCSYNASYFSRIFKEYTGKTFTEYLKLARIEKAAEMILSTGLKIEDIAYQSGYSDKSKFFAHFKEIKGVTPHKFRKCKN